MKKIFLSQWLASYQILIKIQQYELRNRYREFMFQMTGCLEAEIQFFLENSTSFTFVYFIVFAYWCKYAGICSYKFPGPKGVRITVNDLFFKRLCLKSASNWIDLAYSRLVQLNKRLRNNWKLSDLGNSCIQVVLWETQEVFKPYNNHIIVLRTAFELFVIGMPLLRDYAGHS